MLKIGDKVKLKQIIGEFGENYTELEEFIGEVGFIKEVRSNQYYPYGVEFESEKLNELIMKNSDWGFKEEELEVI